MAVLPAFRPDTFDLGRFTDDPGTFFALPSPWCFEPAVFEKEKEAIFSKPGLAEYGDRRTG